MNIPRKPLSIALMLSGLCAVAELPDAALFEHPPVTAGPTMLLDIDCADEAGFNRAESQLERAKELGFGMVLFRLPAERPGFWEKWAAINRHAARLKLKAGFTDFPQSESDGAKGGPAAEKHINRILSMSQDKLPESYGLSLVWCQLVNRADTNITVSAWRDNFAKPISECIQAAGLDAGIWADENPLPPEENGFLFKRPGFAFSTNRVDRQTNRRVAGGARCMGRNEIQCRIQWPSAGTEWRSAVNAALVDGATRVAFEFPDGLPNDNDAVQMLKNCNEYLTRCQWLINYGHPVSDLLTVGGELPEFMERFPADSATPAMLEEAFLRDRRLVFPSSRSYPRLAVAANLLSGGKSLSPLLKAYQNNGLEIGVIPTADNDGTKGHAFPIWDSPGKIPVQAPLTVTSENPLLKLEYAQRSNGDNKLVFIANTTREQGIVTITLVGPPREIQRWNPQDGKIQKTGPTSTVTFACPPDDTFFLIY